MGGEEVGGYVCFLFCPIAFHTELFPLSYVLYVRRGRQVADVLLWNSSDADSDVLADYVLALIRSDAPDDEIRRASIENLEDFLKERSSSPDLICGAWSYGA